MEFKRQEMDPEVVAPAEVPESSHTPNVYHPDPVLSALSSPVILDSVFGNLDLESLKKCREVCSKWSRISRPFLRPNCNIRFCNGNTVHRLADLEGINLPCGVSYYLDDTDSISNLPYILDKIKGTVKCLEISMHGKLLGDPKCQELFTRIELPYLKSLDIMLFLSDDPEDDKVDAAKVNREYCRILLEIIRRAPNLKSFEFYHGRLPIIFWDTLLNSEEGLLGNEMFKNTLDTLTFSFYVTHFNKEYIEAFRKLNLKLKTFKVTVTGNDLVENTMTDDRRQLFAALSIWIKDLSSTLESCSFTADFVNYIHIEKLEFLVEMKVLKNLDISGLGMFDDGIIQLLKKLPKLETLSLSSSVDTGRVVEDAFFDDFHELCFPNLKEFSFDTHYNETEELNPSRFFPKLFPNLKKLSISVYSKNTFLSVIHQLKEMMIEELELYLDSLPEKFETDGITDVPWGWEVPSLASWTRLRKLKLSYSYNYEKVETNGGPQDNTMTHVRVYNMSLRYILPVHLTSLSLIYWGKIDADFLLKLVEGLPLLMHLDMCNGSVVDKSGNLIQHSLIIDKIRNEPLNRSNLSIFNLKAPEDDSTSTKKEDMERDTDSESNNEDSATDSESNNEDSATDSESNNKDSATDSESTNEDSDTDSESTNE